VFTDDVLRYAIAEGRHEVEYTEDDEQAYQLHSVKSIYKWDFTFHAILELVNPFILSPSVRPICLPPIPKNVSITTSSDIVTISTNDQKISYLKNIEQIIIRKSELIINRQKSSKIMDDKYTDKK
ncbi:hypothetical protein KR059_009162, partial [Drosophila kikkawai]